MSSMLSNVSNMAYGACGGVVAECCMQRVVNPSCDWTGEQNASRHKKIVCLFAQIALITTATAAVAIAPQICVPLFTTYSIPGATVLTTCLQGALLATQDTASKWLTKQANGNWTPDKLKRQEHVGRFSNLMELSKFVAGFSTPLIESRINLAAGLATVGYQFVYDLNPERANRLLEPLSQRISKCYWTCIAKSFSIEPQTLIDPERREQFIRSPGTDLGLRKVLQICEGKPIQDVLFDEEEAVQEATPEPSKTTEKT